MELKPRILSVFVLITFLTLMIAVGLKQNSDSKVQESSPSLEDRGVMAWLNTLTVKDFVGCDRMILDKSDSFYSSNIIVLSNDITYYEQTLNALVDCISAIRIKSVVKDTDTGITDYTVSVSLIPYEEIGVLEYDKDALDAVKDSFMKGDISGTAFQNELSQVYYEIFCNNCFELSDKTLQKDLILSEKEVNGVTYVFNTVDFVDSLLSDSNLKRNLSIYEKDVKEKVVNMIKSE